jgi:hypothetical protein
MTMTIEEKLVRSTTSASIPFRDGFHGEP